MYIHAVRKVLIAYAVKSKSTTRCMRIFPEITCYDGHDTAMQHNLFALAGDHVYTHDYYAFGLLAFTNRNAQLSPVNCHWLSLCIATCSAHCTRSARSDPTQALFSPSRLNRVTFVIVVIPI